MCKRWTDTWKKYSLKSYLLNCENNLEVAFKTGNTKLIREIIKSYTFVPSDILNQKCLLLAAQYNTELYQQYKLLSPINSKVIQSIIASRNLELIKTVEIEKDYFRYIIQTQDSEIINYFFGSLGEFHPGHLLSVAIKTQNPLIIDYFMTRLKDQPIEAHFQSYLLAAIATGNKEIVKLVVRRAITACNSATIVGERYRSATINIKEIYSNVVESQNIGILYYLLKIFTITSKNLSPFLKAKIVGGFGNSKLAKKLRTKFSDLDLHVCLLEAAKYNHSNFVKRWIRELTGLEIIPYIIKEFVQMNNLEMIKYIYKLPLTKNIFFYGNMTKKIYLNISDVKMLDLIRRKIPRSHQLNYLKLNREICDYLIQHQIKTKAELFKELMEYQRFQLARYYQS